MIDLKLLRDDPESIRAGIAKKRVEIDFEKVVQLDARRRELQSEVESLRAEQKQAGRAVSSAEGEAREAALADAKALSDRLKASTAAYDEVSVEFDELVARIPNPPHKSVPDGASEEENEVVRVVGDSPQFDFEVRDQEDLGVALGILDIARGARTSGSRFVYLKGAAALLEMALFRYALGIVLEAEFEPVIPPVLVREEAMYATGFFPAERFEFYKAEDEDLFLVGTSEVPLAALHADEIVDGLPLRYAGMSSCFRREAGTYGRDTRGAFRVHQFDKLELFSFTHPDESWDEHERLLAIQEQIISGLGLPYRVVNVCGGDLGAPAAKKYDVEVWMPSEGVYREATSCSNCTDFQARRLKTRFKSDTGKTLVHTLNGTAVAATRWIVFILENFQQADGSVLVPEVLQADVGVERITPPS